MNQNVRWRHPAGGDIGEFGAWNDVLKSSTVKTSVPASAVSGMPDRLYMLDTDGRVIFKSGRGPFGFRPAELEQTIIMYLLDTGKGSTSVPKGQEK